MEIISKKPASKRKSAAKKDKCKSPRAGTSPGKSPKTSPLRRLIPKLPIWEQLAAHGRMNESCVEPAGEEESEQGETSEKPDSAKDLESQLTMNKMEEHDKSFANLSTGNPTSHPTSGGEGNGSFWKDYKVNKTVPVPAWAVVDMTGKKVGSDGSGEFKEIEPENPKTAQEI